MIGSFLVRENGHYPGDYTLSMVIPDGVIEHYRVLRTNNKVEVDGGELQFDTLVELVEVYSFVLVTSGRYCPLLVLLLLMI